MKKAVYFTAIALLISAAVTAQSADQAQAQNQTQTQVQTGTQTWNQDGLQSQIHTRQQLRVNDGTGTGDQLHKRNQSRIQDPAQTMSQTGTQKARLRSVNKTQVCRNPLNSGTRNAMINRNNMRTSKMYGGKR